ncbi:Vacuolar ATP synthase subunit C [Nowakowskiella sp. JEL0407]|nr:Vacuolar ATP synthase subunit C [Nowakowskiella sp. JEL0407]
MAEYWFISAPADPTKQDTVAKLKDKIASKSADYSELFPFSLPDFKIGTLDSLVLLSDDLNKVDATFEGIVGKLSDNLRTLLGDDTDQWRSNLSVNDKSIDQYLRQFQWNTMKYRSDKSLRELADVITQEVNSIDALMKQKMLNYNQVRGQLQGLHRKQVGNLTVRSLNDVVKKEYFVLDSEYLITVLVAVPRNAEKDWFQTYETLTQMIVPRSSQKIAEDDEYGLFTVTLFQRVVDEFTTKCREKKFIVRDFKWDEARMKEEKKQMADTDASEKELWSTVLRLCKTNFGEVFSCWIHIKALRVYVESVLRYGLPPDFQPILIKTKPRQDKKVFDTLIAHYSKLGGAANSSGKTDEHIDENLQILLGDKEYTPFVFYKINLV